MDFLGLLDTRHFVLFTLVLARVGGLVLTAPIYGGRETPLHVRALLALALAALVAPSQWNAAPQCPGNLLDYAVFVGSELLVGACLGLAVAILIAAMHVAGDLISRAGGLSLADVFDSMFNEEIPLLSRVLSLVSVAVFFLIGGHRAVMAGLLDTFAAIPPGNGLVEMFHTAPDGGLLAAMATGLLTLVSESFQLAVRASAPVVLAVLLATLALGFISRTVPQLNVLAVGFGLNSILTFAVMSVSLGAAVWAFQSQVEPAMQSLLETLKVPLQSQWLTHG